MAIDREELEKKAIEAASAEEVMEIVRAAGEEITAEEAASFFKAVQERKADKELSLDELEAVAGGEDRDWLRDGCAATVEAGSDCYGTDMCGLWPVTYEHRPTRHKCSVCGGILYSNGSTGGGFFEEEVYHYKCASCGAQFKTHGGELIKYSK
jgi:hypothetical protein